MWYLWLLLLQHFSETPDRYPCGKKRAAMFTVCIVLFDDNLFDQIFSHHSHHVCGTKIALDRKSQAPNTTLNRSQSYQSQWSHAFVRDSIPCSVLIRRKTPIQCTVIHDQFVSVEADFFVHFLRRTSGLPVPGTSTAGEGIFSVSPQAYRSRVSPARSFKFPEQI